MKTKEICSSILSSCEVSHYGWRLALAVMIRGHYGLEKQLKWANTSGEHRPWLALMLNYFALPFNHSQPMVTNG